MAVSPEVDPSTPLLEAHELYRFFHTGEDEVFALRGVSLQIMAGEFVSIIGPSGSGKSTLLGCLAGLDEPDGGHVTVAGKRITRRREHERAALRSRFIGTLFQSGNLIEHFTLDGNIRLAWSVAGRQQHGVPAALLESVGLAERARAWPSVLSGGESVRAGLAVALANDPPVLVADEPTGEVDEASERTVLDLLRRRADDGRGVVVVTHSDRVAAASDRVIRLASGRIADE